MMYYTKLTVGLFGLLFFLVSCNDDDSMTENEILKIDDQIFTVDRKISNGDLIGKVQVSGSFDEISYRLISQSTEGAIAIAAENGNITVADESLFKDDENTSFTAEVEVSAGEMTEAARITINIEELSERDLEVIEYFKEIALGFEFGNASMVTRTWTEDVRIFVMGQPTTANRNELNRIIAELNDLIEKNISLRLVDSREEANYEIFFGSGGEYAAINSNAANFIASNWGLFFVSWNGNNDLISGTMYVDIFRASEIEQAHLLREELTQSLGLARDSDLYFDSIFQSSFSTKVTEYSEFDRELIRLLYNPAMINGLDADRVDPILRAILAAD